MNAICVASVVEGHGEVEAVPCLLRRLAFEWDPSVGFKAPKPVRQGRGKLTKAGGVESAVKLAALKDVSAGVLVLLDADRDCPAELGPMLARAKAVHEDVAVVVAKTEFEAWFIAAAPSIGGCRGLREELTVPNNVEEVRDAKGWLQRSMSHPKGAYSEVLDQPALAAQFDIAMAAENSDSFDKLCRELRALFAALRDK
jgi:uncharacterized protein DUF4276